MSTGNTAWFEDALEKINADLGGVLEPLSPDQIEVAKHAMLAALRTTIAANPQGFRDMLIRLAPHRQRSVDAAAKYPF